MRSFKSNDNIHKKEGGSYYVVSANKASSVTLQSPGNESQSLLENIKWRNLSFVWLSGDYRRIMTMSSVKITSCTDLIDNAEVISSLLTKLASRCFFTLSRFTSGDTKRYKLWSCQNVCEALIYLLDNIYIRFCTKLCRQIVGIPMGTNWI